MMLRLVQAILLITCLLSGSPSNAQSQAFEAGYQAYMRNQFPVAEAHFKRALTAAKTREDRAFILKFLGISQFMRGDRKQAANSFYQAFMNDQKTAIYQEEVLDPTVVDFYNNLKNRWVQAQQARQRQLEQQRLQGQQAREPAAPTPPSNRQLVESNQSQGERISQEEPTNLRFERLRATQRRRSSSREEVRSQSNGGPSRDINWLHFMPFGAGQFYNGQYFAGSFFLGSQAFAIATYIRRNDQASQETARRDEFLENPLYTDEQKKEFGPQFDDRIALLQNEASYAAIGFGLSWGIGILHAVLSAPKVTIESPAAFGTGYVQPPNLQDYEELDHWYIDRTMKQDYFAIGPRGNGGWYINISLALP